MNNKFLALLLIAALAFYAACKKAAPCNSTVYRGAVVSPDTVRDFDGNAYSVVKIGNQKWLQQNLRASHYQNGVTINSASADSLRGLDSLSWVNIYNNGLTTAAWCYYNGDSVYGLIFGKLYNWYAVTNSNQLCPAGFHVPSDAEWHALILTLDSCAILGDPESTTAGSQLKVVSTWTTYDSLSTNTSKFTAYPAGYADPTRTFGGLDSLSYFWTATSTSLGAWDLKLNSADSSVHRFAGDMHNGFSVRCVGN